MWKYGDEQWCNLEGRYLHLVADLRQQYLASSTYEATICSLGVYGTKYSRTGEQASDSVQITSGESSSITLNQIESEFEIGTASGVYRVRQKANNELSFVTFRVNDEDQAVIFIDTAGQDVGNYTLILESYDATGSIGTALKTDTITITIVSSPLQVSEVTVV